MTALSLHTSRLGGFCVFVLVRCWCEHCSVRLARVTQVPLHSPVSQSGPPKLPFCPSARPVGITLGLDVGCSLFPLWLALPQVGKWPRCLCTRERRSGARLSSESCGSLMWGGVVMPAPAIPASLPEVIIYRIGARRSAGSSWPQDVPRSRNLVTEATLCLASACCWILSGCQLAVAERL